MSTNSATHTAPLTIDALEEKVLQAFRLWHTHEHEGSPLDVLQSYQLICNRNICNNGQSAIRQASNELLRRGLDALRISHPDEHTILYLRFADEQPVQVVANRMNLAEGSVLRKQQQGVRHVADFLFHHERQARTTQRDKLFTRLPSTDTVQLWGVEEAVQEVSSVLLPGQAPWMVMIEGAAGIGKSALAEDLSRKVIDLDLWEEFAWVAIKQPTLGLANEGIVTGKCEASNEAIIDTILAQIAPDVLERQSLSLEERFDLLSNRLKERAHLIVIDGMEAHPESEGLMTMLNRLINPSKVLITSRLRTYRASGTYHFTLGELCMQHTLHLLRLEAKLRNLRDVASASDDELYPIYALIGGNPLAARWVVEELHIYPLNQVLSDLATASGACISNLYEFLFQRVWELLDAATRHASLPLLLITEAGDTLEELVLAVQNQISREDLRSALEIYVKHGLLDVRGTFVERRYVLHHLTRTYLRQQMIRWVFDLDRQTPDSTTRFEQFINETLFRMSELVRGIGFLPWEVPSFVIIEKTKYLMEYALHYESLWSPALGLLLLIAPMLEGENVKQQWLPMLRKALQVCKQRGEEKSEARLIEIIQPGLPQRAAGVASFSKLLPERVI